MNDGTTLALADDHDEAFSHLRVTRGRFAQMVAYVNRTDVPALLEEMLHPPASGGRPRQLRIDVLLAGIMITLTATGHAHLTLTHRLLTQVLSRQTQVDFGIRPRFGAPITLDQVRYLWRTIARQFDTAPLSGSRPGPELDEAEITARQTAFADVLTRLVGAASIRLHPAPAYSVDLTAIDSAAIQHRDAVKKKDGRTVVYRWSADPDARHGHRTKTFENRSAFVFGYQLLAMARTAQVDGPEEPFLIDRADLVPGNKKAIGKTIRALQSLAAEGRAPKEILVDRGFSYSAPAKWADRLRELGVAQVLDMHTNDRGRRPHPDGYIMIDGWPHCPCVPERLTTIVRPAHLSLGNRPQKEGRSPADYRRLLTRWRRQKKALKAARALINERMLYRFELHGHTSAGNPRFKCPARTGKITCQGCPFSSGGTVMDGSRPHVTAPSPLPKACSAETITVPWSVDRKRRQDTYWLSDEWIASYGRRCRVEGWFGTFKSHPHGGIRRGWTRHVGLVRTGLLLALAIAALNLIQLISWARRTGDTRDEIALMDTTDYGFAEYDAHGNLDIGPPEPEPDAR